MSKLFRALKRSFRSLQATEYAKKTGKRDWVYVLSEIKDGAMDTLWYSWTDKIINFKDRLVHIAKWLPILWKDRDWDHHYILEILKQKIRFQREHIRDYGHHTRTKEDCHNMRIAELLIQRIQDDNYCEVEEDLIRDKYKDERATRKKSEPMIAGGLTCAWVGPSDAEYKELKKIYIKQKYMKNQDYDYLFKHLKKYLEHWWD